MSSPKLSNAILPFVAADLGRGDVGILPTDTLYGIVGSALRPRTVKRIYKLRRRNPAKPMIILIGDVRDLARFGVRPDKATLKILKRVWPGKVSVVLPLKTPAGRRKFAYLHRGTNTLAFRFPEPAWLRALVRETGPLVAPSANFEGRPPARTVKEAKNYFGDNVRFYIDAGSLRSKPSTLIKIANGHVELLRKGAAAVDAKSASR
jgi:L-threonylcarbamoyladenylate synthase